MLAGLQTLQTIRGERPRTGDDGAEAEGDESGAGPIGRELQQFLLIAGYLVLIWLAGFLLASLLFLIAFLTGIARMRVLPAVAYTALVLGFFQLVSTALNLRWAPGLIFR